MVAIVTPAPANAPAVIGIALGAVIALAAVVFALSYGNLYAKALLAGAHVAFAEIIGMRLRGVNPRVVIDSRVLAMAAGVPIATRDLEAHYLAGGNVPNVTRALVTAHKAGVPLDFQEACSIDLAGRNVLEAVKLCVTPAVFETEECPVRARDGVPMTAVAHVTARTRIANAVGGAGMDAVLVRIAEALDEAVADIDTYQEVLRNPSRVSDRIMAEEDLDVGASFEIVSVAVTVRLDEAGDTATDSL